MQQTFAQKVLAKKSGLEKVTPGQIVEIQPDSALSHDNSEAIERYFKEMGGTKVFDPMMNVIVLDHASPAPSTKHADNHRKIRKFVTEQNIKFFYDIGRGVCHQVLIEEGLALPGEIVLGSDSHTPHAGVMGAFAAGIGRSEMASIWALGQLWLRVPESMKIICRGKLSSGVTSKDLALHVIGDIGSDSALYLSVEWHGEAIEALELSQRAVLTNLAAEMGAKNSYIPPDEKVFDYLKNRAKRKYEPIYPNTDAVYTRIVEYDASSIVPMVACPHSVEKVRPLSELSGKPVDQAFLGTCTNGRFDDLAAAAQVLKGRKIAAGTRMIVIPASSEVFLEAVKAGYIEAFINAGAVIEGPSCGPCLGSHKGIPATGDVVISSANRNFRGRMGTKDSEIYLASPQVVAASAVAGFIVHPSEL